MRNFIYLFFIVSLLVSCGNEINDVENDLKDRDVTLVDSIKNIQGTLSYENEASRVVCNVDWDTIHYDTTEIPTYDTKYISNIITTGTFHADEFCEEDEKEKWYGIFKNKLGFYLADTQIKTERANDISDEDDEKTGWNIETVNKDTSVILIAGPDFLSNRKIEQVALKEVIIPGDTLKFKFLGIDYKLFATGGKCKVQTDPEYYEMWNYKLFLSITKKGKTVSQLLVAQPRFNDAVIDIIFAGDIDGDGLLDLIINTSSHYNASAPTLYLSKPADKESLLKIAGRHVSVGC